MDRREFSKIMGTVVAAVVAGAQVAGSEKDAFAKRHEVHVCKGFNSCKGKGGCSSGDAGCAGKNSCKGKGGCASKEAKHGCAGKNSCKGQGGCAAPPNDAGCAGKNSCKGKGGCPVPVNPAHLPARPQ